MEVKMVEKVDKNCCKLKICEICDQNYGKPNLLLTKFIGPKVVQGS